MADIKTESSRGSKKILLSPVKKISTSDNSTINQSNSINDKSESKKTNDNSYKVKDSKDIKEELMSSFPKSPPSRLKAEAKLMSPSPKKKLKTSEKKIKSTKKVSWKNGLDVVEIESFKNYNLQVANPDPSSNYYKKKDEVNCNCMIF